MTSLLTYGMYLIAFIQFAIVMREIGSGHRPRWGVVIDKITILALLAMLKDCI